MELRVIQQPKKLKLGTLIELENKVYKVIFCSSMFVDDGYYTKLERLKEYEVKQWLKNNINKWTKKSHCDIMEYIKFHGRNNF